MLIIEICLCAPFSNVPLERLFSKMNFIKTTVCNSSTNDSLNFTLSINISGLSLQSFHDEHLEKFVNYWFNVKNCHLTQHKHNLYKNCGSKKTKQPHFNILDISQSESHTDSSASGNYKSNFIPLHLLM